MRKAPANKPASTGLWTAPLLAVVIVVTIVAAGFGVPGGWLPGTDGARIMVTTDDVNLRTGPGTGFSVLIVVAAGTEVSVHGEDYGFASVTASGRQGWISREFLSDPGSGLLSSSVQVVEAAGWHESVDESAPTVAPASGVAEDVQVQAELRSGEHWIEVNRSTRTVTLHDGEIIVAQFDALIGKDPAADGYYSTAVGTYQVWVKEKALTATPFAEGVYLTDFVGFDPDRHNGFHSPTRDANGNVVVTGGTQTLGCVRLGEADAIALYEFAHIGMRVEVHD